jgi:hypothetical protein
LVLIFITPGNLPLDIVLKGFVYLGRLKMAFLTAFATIIATQNKQAIAQSLVVDKRTVSSLSNLIRVNTKRHWKPLCAAGAVVGAAFAAYKVRTEILRQREKTRVGPTTNEVENLSESASLPEVGSPLDVGMYGELDTLADCLLEELELEECLEVDPAFIADQRFIDVEQVQAIKDCKDESVQEQMDIKYKMEVQRKSRKRVRGDRLPHACRAMVAKLRASFPTPDGSPLQQKAMALYLAKEGRKLKMRETQLAVLIPRAVALASVPSNSQVNMRLLMAIEPVRFKYQRMKWGGVIGAENWLSRLVSALPNIQ